MSPPTAMPTPNLQENPLALAQARAALESLAEERLVVAGEEDEDEDADDDEDADEDDDEDEDEDEKAPTDEDGNKIVKEHAPRAPDPSDNSSS